MTWQANIWIAIVIIALAGSPVAAQFITDNPDEPLISPLEAHAKLGPELVAHNDYINTVLRIVVSRGYRCDTISSIERTLGPMSFEIDCNRHRLNYVIGGDADHPTVTPEQ